EGPDRAFGYYAGLDADGSVLLGRMDNAWTLLARRAFPVRTNTWYRLKVTMDGPRLRLFVNGAPTPHLSVTDPTHPRGQIGVRAFRAEARFDNLVFSNTAPLRLNLRREGEAWELSWPETAVNVRPHSAVRLTGPGEPVSRTATLTGRTWRVHGPVTGEPARFFWLEAD
ncbi:MAG: hypothetical protein D6766_04890, partial [Verrucomicrobia bacterium]